MAAYLIATALAVCGTVNGLMLHGAISSVPRLGPLSPEAYVRAKQFSGPRLDPLMPILVCLSAVLDFAGAVLAPTTAVRVPALFACAAALAVIVISQLVNVPINRWVAAMDPDRLPADFAARDPRPRWRRAHLLRTVLTGAAVLANLIAITALTS